MLHVLKSEVSIREGGGEGGGLGPLFLNFLDPPLNTFFCCSKFEWLLKWLLMSQTILSTNDLDLDARVKRFSRCGNLVNLTFSGV